MTSQKKNWSTQSQKQTVTLGIGQSSWLNPPRTDQIQTCSEGGCPDQRIREVRGGPRCLDSLTGGISSEPVFGFVNLIEKHQAASANG